MFVSAKSSSEILCEWDKLVPKNKITVKYLLFKDNECIYSGPANTFRVENLTPSTSYTFTVQNVTIENSEKSPMSDPLVAHTLETVPSEPVNFRVIGSTTNLIRVAWEPPDKLNGNLKNYFVYIRRACLSFFYLSRKRKKVEDEVGK